MLSKTSTWYTSNTFQVKLNCTQKCYLWTCSSKCPYGSCNTSSIGWCVTHANKANMVPTLIFMHGNYIGKAEKHVALPNQRYLWVAWMDFLYFSINYKQDCRRLRTAIEFDSLVWPTFEKISDFSVHNVYWDMLYYFFKWKLPFLVMNSEQR